MPVTCTINPPVTNEALNRLFAASWAQHTARDFEPVHARSLVYVCAFDERQAQQLVGYVNAAWDGGIHAFLLDTTVHPSVRRQGIGVALVRQAVDAARERGMLWLHVDYEPHLAAFYQSCGFRSTSAGILSLR